MTPAPSPLALARMHETEFKQHLEGLTMTHRLIEQIMVGRRIAVPAWEGRVCLVTKVKAKGGSIQLYGRIGGRGAIRMLCSGLDFVTIVQQEPAST